LIEERRVLSNPAQFEYHLRYEYDQGGDRTDKTSTEAVDQPLTEMRYEYDIDDVPLYGTATNQLMQYETFDTSEGGETLLSTTYYFYNDVGNPTRVVTELEAPEPGQPRFSGTLMHYAANGQAVTYVMGETWNNEGSGIADYTQTYAREFRYDGGRQRYMDAALNEVLAVIETQTDWTDYDGDQAYATFGFDATNQLVRLESWEPGLARVQQPSFPTASGQYFHTDHLGTTRHMSVSEGYVFEAVAYSAFGEQVGGVDFHRFGYAGAYGYQANPGFPFLHVGARYYDPAAGRFLQRDPIGVLGGSNIYVYAEGNPVAGIDPHGLNNVPACQDACDTWRPFAPKNTRENCYMSCIGGYWPPPPAPQPPPKNFTPWPGPNPPISPPRPPGPSPSGTSDARPFVLLAFLGLLTVLVRQRQKRTQHCPGAMP